MRISRPMALSFSVLFDWHVGRGLWLVVVGLLKYPDNPNSGFSIWWDMFLGPYVFIFVFHTKPSAYRARRQSGFPTFIPCQRQDAHVLPERRQSHQGDKLCDVSTVALVARWPVFLARGSDADGEPHCFSCFRVRPIDTNVPMSISVIVTRLLR